MRAALPVVVASTRFYVTYKTRPRSVAYSIRPGTLTSSSARKRTEQWGGYIQETRAGAGCLRILELQREEPVLYFTYCSLNATMATLGHLGRLLSPRWRGNAGWRMAGCCRSAPEGEAARNQQTIYTPWIEQRITWIWAFAPLQHSTGRSCQFSIDGAAQ